MSKLATSKEPVAFSTLTEELDLTRGNLSAHLRKLQDAELITVTKEFVDLRPRTTYECTPKGRREIKAYLREVEDILRSI